MISLAEVGDRKILRKFPAPMLPAAGNDHRRC